ncbi:MAG: glycoside hydrolase family 71/99-like protein [Verrucomicrobiota bacterium]|nr:glycoside hydrolase family 71/99-like protein [Verrucomicrobiota bacterium]
MAHYMPWYTAPPVSRQWGWHWTMNRFDPEVWVGEDRRQIASWYYPLIGPYDSADPVVLEYHVLLMKLGGIDGVFADWYGTDEYLDYARIHERARLLFEWTRRAGLWFCLCYEDRSIARMIQGGYLASAAAVQHARQTLRTAETLFFQEPGYLRWQHRPVLLNFGPMYFTGDQWPVIFAGLRTSNQPAFFTLDRRVTGAMGGFNWPPMWATATNNGVLSAGALQDYLDGFDRKATSWPAFISGAFPRFHDYYAPAGAGPSYGYLADAEGETFRFTLDRALTNASAFVQLITWNDFGEGTVIEPTREFAYRDLEIVQEARRRWIDPAFPHGPAELRLPMRLYQLRRRDAGRETMQAELDEVFHRIVQGDVEAARRLLDAMEQRRPLLTANLIAADALELRVGGYRSTSGVEIQYTTNLVEGRWQVVSTLRESDSLLRFQIQMPPHGPSLFFRARNR